MAKPKTWRVAVDLPVVDGDVAAGRDPDQIDHSSRRAECQGEEEGSNDEVRREQGRRLRRRGGGCRSVPHRGFPDVAQELFEWEPVDGRKPGEGFLRAFLSAAVAEAITLEDRPRRREAAREFPDGHSRRHEVMRFGRRIGGLEIANDFREVPALRGAGVFQRMHPSAAAVDPVGGEY